MSNRLSEGSRKWFWENPIKKLFKAKVPELSKFIGRSVLLPTGERITVEKIVGNRFNYTMYEINDTHLIGMLRFHAQMEGDKSITEEQFKAFEEMEMDAEKMPDAPKKKLMGEL